MHTVCSTRKLRYTYCTWVVTTVPVVTLSVTVVTMASICFQVAELALTKLFQNFSMEELTSSMAEMMIRVNTKPDIRRETLEKTPTLQQRLSITVREIARTHTHTYAHRS